MNRRDLIKTVGLTALTAGMLGVLTGCKDAALRWIGVVIATLKELLPILGDLVPGAEAEVNKAIAVAESLEDALRNKATNAIDFLQQLVAPDGLFNKIVDIVGLVVDPQTRAILSGSLAIVGLALRLIANELNQPATQKLAQAADANVLEQVLKQVRF